MSAAVRVLALLLAVLMLSACAGHRTRPASRHVPGVAPDVPGKPAGSRGPSDDLNLPQSERYRQSHDSGPDGKHVDVFKLPVPVPHAEPRSRYGNKSPYTVLGHTYRVLRSARGYDEKGIASWYGNKFHGYMTSSLEPYDMYKFTAASKVLPLPTWARVTNLANGKSIIVRVNDRGPFVANRLIDLSYAAAVRIGIWPKGTGLVEVQALDPRHPKELPAPEAVTHTAAAHPIWLQVGAFSNRANAERVAAQLRSARLAPVQVSTVSVHGRTVTRVRLGPLADVDAADHVSAEVVKLGLPEPQVAVD
ncbi:septal ring lytic transglycosylase RlpA family protein [Oleiagrimonas sp. C23AA]|uniref:septal ring lytic transglycosylase RlpA family protein n=1 Tax=Oleiagrimonas sp. C23AA TaxID=2719047 RepID=UPI0031B6CC84